MSNNMTLQAKRRYLQDTLINAGSAVMAFSVWGVAKAVLFFILTDESQIRALLPVDDTVSMTALFVSVAAAALIDIILRAYVGLSARAEGNGKKKGSFYLFVAVLAGFVNMCSAIAIIFGQSLTLSFIDMALSLLIEITTLSANVFVVYSAVRLRRLNETAE